MLWRAPKIDQWDERRSEKESHFSFVLRISFDFGTDYNIKSFSELLQNMTFYQQKKTRKRDGFKGTLVNLQSLSGQIKQQSVFEMLVVFNPC